MEPSSMTRTISCASMGEPILELVLIDCNVAGGVDSLWHMLENV